MEAGRRGNVEVVMRLHENMCGSEASYLCVHQSRIVNLRWEVHRRLVLCASWILFPAKWTKNRTKDLALYRTFYDIWSLAFRGSQRDVVYYGWPIAPSYMSSNAGGRGWGGLRGHSQSIQLWHNAHCTWSPNKLWRSNSIFNLCWQSTERSAKHMYWVKYREKKVFNFWYFFCSFGRSTAIWPYGPDII